MNAPIGWFKLLILVFILYWCLHLRGLFEFWHPILGYILSVTCVFYYYGLVRAIFFTVCYTLLILIALGVYLGIPALRWVSRAQSGVHKLNLIFYQSLVFTKNVFYSAAEP